jgi:hypothetical protein
MSKETGSDKTLRDYFAAEAMAAYIAGMMSNKEIMLIVASLAKSSGLTTEEYVAEKAYVQADEMLKVKARKAK